MKVMVDIRSEGAGVAKDREEDPLMSVQVVVAAGYRGVVFKRVWVKERKLRLVDAIMGIQLVFCSRIF